MPETIRDSRGEEHLIDEHGYLVDGVLVKVDLSEIIDLDLEGFLDLISEDSGFPLLMGQTYVIEGHEENTLQIRVHGDVTAHLEEDCDVASD